MFNSELVVLMLMQLAFDDVIQTVLFVVQVVLGIVIIYKFMGGKLEKKFLKKVEWVIGYMKNQSHTESMGRFIELVFNILASDKLDDNQLEQIVEFMRRVGGI